MLAVFDLQVDAIFWMQPVLITPLVSALCCDYGVFLGTRIREYRLRGFTMEAAVIKGYYKTGPVISVAGIIMLLAFGTLMLSSQLLLVECGFVLAFSVAIDTFLVRSLLVPAILFVIGDANWYAAHPGVRLVVCAALHNACVSSGGPLMHVVWCLPVHAPWTT